MKFSRVQFTQSVCIPGLGNVSGVTRETSVDWPQLTAEVGGAVSVKVAEETPAVLVWPSCVAYAWPLVEAMPVAAKAKR